jgi:type IV pilus biogenesis protein CpaD/CtpE
MFQRGLMMRKTTHLIAICALALLTACTVTTPSQVKTADIRVIDDFKTVSVRADRVNPTEVSVVSRDYINNGSNGMRLLMPYRTGSRPSETAAKQNAEDYRRAFEKAGVRDFRVEYVGMDDGEHLANGVISYRALQADAPADCTRMPHYKGGETFRENDDYMLGCENKLILSKMIVRPADLLGRDGTPAGHSRRDGMIIEESMSGKPNEPLDAQGASDVGG